MTARRPSGAALRRGTFIVLEGLDGAGTTTQAERLSRALGALGHRVRVTRQPSDGPIGAQLRLALTGRLKLPNGAGPLTEDTLALLFAADRLDHLAGTVEPALARGELVICDRYLLSSLAYQGTALPMAWVESINAQAMKPDLTLFLQVEAATAATRRAVRGQAAELFEADERQARIAKQYLAAIRRRASRERIVRIDGGRSVEEVTAACLEELALTLGLGMRAPARRRAGAREPA